MTPEQPTVGYLGLNGWGGPTWTRVDVVGSTIYRWRIRAIVDTRLAGRRRILPAGYTALVPRAAVRLGQAPPQESNRAGRT